MSSSQVIFHDFVSESLKGNPLNDPHSRPLTIYLPPDYDALTGPLPVLYLLASYASTGRSYLNFRPWEENIQERMDRLISEGICRPMIVVLPDGFCRYGGTQYIDSSATGKYHSYLIEIVNFIDRNYKSSPQPAFRAIAGKSSGGYGALVNAMFRPDVFGLVADHSGDKFFEKVYARDLLSLPDLIARMDWREALSNPYRVHPKSREFFQLMSVAAMCAAYSPNPKAEFGFDWPIDLYTGELDQRVWNRWLENDPIHLLSEYDQALRSLRFLYFDCGNRDEYFIHLGCRLLARKLEELGIDFTYEEFDGSHRGTSHRYDRSLELMSDAFPK